MENLSTNFPKWCCFLRTRFGSDDISELQCLTRGPASVKVRENLFFFLESQAIFLRDRESQGIFPTEVN